MVVKFKTRNRSQIITSQLVGKTLKVYNGKLYQLVLITNEMIGHKLGEFSLTKKLGSSIHLSEKNKKKKEKRKN